MRPDSADDGTAKKAGKTRPNRQAPGADSRKASDPPNAVRKEAVEAGWIAGATDDPAFFIKESGV